MSDEIKDLEPTEENTAPDATEEVSLEPGPFDATPDQLTHGSADSTEAAVEAPGPVGAEDGHDPTSQPAEEAAGQDPAAVDATAGDAVSPVEGATAEDQGTLNLPATGEPSSSEPEPMPAAPGEPTDMAGAPSAGKPIDAAVPVVPTDVGYPVPKEDENEAPIHPTTGEPMKGDGLGDDLGKTAEDAKGTDSTASAPAASADAPVAEQDPEGNNVAELEEAVAKLSGRFDAIDGKLEGLEKQLKRILHKL